MANKKLNKEFTVRLRSVGGLGSVSLHENGDEIVFRVAGKEEVDNLYKKIREAVSKQISEIKGVDYGRNKR